MFFRRAPDRNAVTRALQPLHTGNDGDVIIQDGHVLATVPVDPAQAGELETVRQAAENAIRSLRGVKSARVILTAERAPSPQLHQPQLEKPKGSDRPFAPDVRQIIAVASGKGGVGKSTVAVNLAAALALQGLRVGLLDADIYGPSVPMLTGLRGRKPRQEDDYLVPLEAHGMKVISIGFLIDEAKAMIWRGPMVQTAVQQLLRDVAWGELDILVLDMPPGTGDTQLTIAQKLRLAGAVIVSTPQDIALLDAVRGVQMFQRMDVPILGLVENMSVFCCPSCGTQTPIFGAHGARDKASELGIEFLGDVPLAAELRATSDAGVPAVLQPGHPSQDAFRHIAAKVMEGLRVTQQPQNAAAK